MSSVIDVALDALPERYHALLLRFEAVRPDCARVARLAIARGEQTGRPYDVTFLAGLVERAERQTPAAPSARRPVDPDLTLRRMSPRAGEVAQRMSRDLPRTMDRVADASDGIAALIPALRDAFRQIEERVEGSLSRE